MKNVAYKTSQNNPNLPNGYITEHFETNEDSVEGYLIVSAADFNTIFANNEVILKAFTEAKGIITTGQNTVQPTARSESPAHIPTDVKQQMIAQVTANKAQAEQDSILFKQFLAWKASQGGSS